MSRAEKNRRNFKRYKCGQPAKVSSNGRTLNAEIVDYSLSGLKLLFEDSPPVKDGDSLRVENKELLYPADGRVVWSRKVREGLMAGFSRSARKGLLKHYLLPDVLHGLRRSFATGMLKVRSGPVEKTVYVRAGEVIYAASDAKEDGLGDMLLREGRIAEKDYARSIELAALTGKNQAAVLVELGHISPAELVGAVHRQVEGIIMSLFDIALGEVEFIEGVLPEGKVIKLRLPVGDLIYRGVKKASAHMGKFTGVSPDALLAFSDDPLNLYQKISYDDADRAMLSNVDGKSRLKELISRSGLAPAAARRSIAALLSAAVVEIVEEETVNDAVEPEKIIETPSSPAGIKAKIEELYANYGERDYYSLFGLRKGETEGLRKAFHALSREFHPDRHFNLSGDARSKLNEIFSHVTQAYRTLADPEKRGRYDASLQTSGARPSSREELAREKYSAGMAEYKNKRFGEAERFFAHAAYLDGGVAGHHLHHGLALAALGEMKKAEQALRRAAELEPSNDEILAELGHVYLRLGFPLRAKGSFKRALKENPSNGRAKQGLSGIP